MNYYAVEHYKPKDKFPELETKYSNLYYACGTCNSYKGNFWPNEAQAAANIFIPNPCDHEMHSHLRITPSAEIESASSAGKWTIDALDLNKPMLVTKRIYWINAKKKAEKEKRELLSTINELQKRCDTAIGQAQIDLITDLEQLNQLLDECNSTIEYIGD